MAPSPIIQFYFIFFKKFNNKNVNDLVEKDGRQKDEISTCKHVNHEGPKVLLD